mgnify:CR=1 FL=1
MQTPRALLWTVVVCLPAGSSAAQTINGVAEWTMGRGVGSNDGSQTSNGLFAQRYSVGIDGFVLDPRLVRCTGEVTFRSTSLTNGVSPDAGDGHQADTGYKVGLSLFPRRPFPLSLEMSRDVLDESGAVPTESGPRGAIVVPSGTALPAVQTRTRTFNLGWRLNVPDLPSVDLGYRASDASATGGGFEASQANTEMHANARWARPRARQELRLQQTSYENHLSAFDQQWSSVDYQLDGRFSDRTTATVRAGRHHTESMLPVVSTDAAYQPPPATDAASLFAASTLSYQATPSLALDVATTLERQSGGTVATSAALVSATGRLEVGHGVSLSATAVSGARGQVVAEDVVNVWARSVLASANYRVVLRGLQIGASGSRGLGSSVTPEGVSGDTSAWTGEAHAGVTVGWLSWSTAYDRARSADGVLAFGNYDAEHWRSTWTASAGHASTSISWDAGRAWRGVDETRADTLQRHLSATAAWRLAPSTQLSASTGWLSSDGTYGRDQQRYGGVSFDAQPVRRLHVLASIRVEDTVATQAALAQWTVAGAVQADYRLRLFTFGVDYRHTGQELQLASLASPFRLRGHLFQVRMARKFGVRV